MVIIYNGLHVKGNRAIGGQLPREKWMTQHSCIQQTVNYLMRVRQGDRHLLERHFRSLMGNLP